MLSSDCSVTNQWTADRAVILERSLSYANLLNQISDTGVASPKAGSGGHIPTQVFVNRLHWLRPGY